MFGWIALLLFAIQLTLGVSMIAAASVAANRQMSAVSGSVDRVFRIVGRSTLALGLWGLVASTAPIALMVANGSFDGEVWALGIAGEIYSVLLTLGGWLQVSVSELLQNTLPLEVQRRRDWRVGALRLSGWTLALMPLGPLVAIYLLLAALFNRAIRVQQESLLLTLAIGMRTGSPLADEIDALADTCRGRYRGRLHKLARRLRDGEPLSHALEADPLLCPRSALTSIRLGEELGDPSRVIAEEALRLRFREELKLSGQVTLAGLAFYICSVTCIAATIVAFMSYWIIPKIHRIFSDFGTELPLATRVLDQVVEFGLQYALWAFGLAVFVAVPLLLWLVRRGGLATVNWGLLTVFYPRAQTPALLRNLASAVSLSCPLPTALGRLELWHPQRFVRRKLRRIRIDLEQGTDSFSLLCRQRLLRPREAEALASAQRAGNLPWALEAIADTIDRRHEALVQRTAEVIKPVALFALGGLVAAIAVGFFVPLVRLLNAAVQGL